MNNFRLQINNIDKSQSLDIDDNDITTFTIVDSPKGPQKPYYIPPGKFALMGEVFGYPSKTYSELQELYDLNSGYGIWVSAPYNPIGSKIPAAYVTPAGVFAKHTPITLGAGEFVEDIEEEEISVEGLSTLTADPNILIPVGQEDYLFTASGSAVTDVLNYTSGTGIQIDLSFDVGTALGAPTTTPYHFLNTESASIAGAQIMEAASAGFGVLTFIIPGKDPLDITVELSGSDLILKTGSAGTGTTIGTLVAGDGDQIVIDGAAAASLSGDYATYFATETLDSLWSNSTFINSVKVYWKATVAKENIMATIYPKFVSDRTSSISFAEADFNNNIKNTVTEIIDTISASYTFAWSLDPAAKDGFGNSLEVTSKVDNETLVNIHVFKTFDGFIFTKTGTAIGPTDFTLPQVKLTGGSRVSVADIDAFWTEAQDPAFSEVDVFFSLITPANDSAFFSLNDIHSLARFVFPKHVTKANATTSLTKLNFGHNYWATTAQFARGSVYTAETLTSSLTGAYVKMVCDALAKANGGAALMYLNDNNGLGGQLDISVKKALTDYKYSDDQLKILNDKNYNPIILSPYGVMVTSHKTCKSGELSDWSYIGHTSAFLDFQKQVKNLVMTPQIGKANNDYYRELRAEQVEDLLRLRTEGDSRIWASGTVDTSTTNVNTDDVLAERKFKLVVSVKVDIFSEGVELLFISEGQV